MIDGYKLILTSLLDRIKTVTGVRYGDDSTFLAWETGNEMQWQRKGKQPAPAAWTIEIGKHIKSLAPCALVMDGSYSKSDTSESAFRPEVLESKEVDIMSYHYYGSKLDRHSVYDIYPKHISDMCIPRQPEILTASLKTVLLRRSMERSSSVVNMASSPRRTTMLLSWLSRRSSQDSAGE